MSLIKRSSISQIEITSIGHIQVRLLKQVIDDADGSIISTEYHRTSIQCGTSVMAQVDAVNTHLIAMGWPAVPPQDWEQVQAHADVKWTPEVLADWNAVKQKAIVDLSVANN